jgi:hypothetical protein
MTGDPIERRGGAPADEERPRQRYLLDEGEFDEVPPKYRRFYRHWKGPGDEIGPNEVLCPVCKVVIRSTRELRAGDRLYCMACMTRLRVRVGDTGRLEADCEY